MYGGGMKGAVCLVIGCTTEPGDEVTIESNGFTLVYSACEFHATEMRWGATYAERRSESHGLLGLRRIL